MVVLQALRALAHLTIVVAVGYWGFTDWALPWPGLLAGTGIVLLAIVIWALFLSPRPVLHTDRFGLALVELLFIGAGVFAMLAAGLPWGIAVAFGLFAAALGYIVPNWARK